MFPRVIGTLLVCVCVCVLVPVCCVGVCVFACVCEVLGLSLSLSLPTTYSTYSAYSAYWAGKSANARRNATKRANARRKRVEVSHGIVHNRNKTNRRGEKGAKTTVCENRHAPSQESGRMSARRT